MLAAHLVEEVLRRPGKPLLSFLQAAPYALYRFTVVPVVGDLEQLQRIFHHLILHASCGFFPPSMAEPGKRYVLETRRQDQAQQEDEGGPDKAGAG